ncbi:MAG: YihY/virulence factor BrkB family protein [Clostridia bacterium]|nr:YihY/virulence factor BrkB family protein [Clostridia bacterium]
MNALPLGPWDEWSSRLIAAGRRFAHDEGSIRAAALAYYSFFALFPLVLLVAAVVGHWLPDVLSRLNAVLLPYFPGSETLVAANLRRLVDLSRGMTLAGAAGLLWSASNLFAGLDRAMTAIFCPPLQGRRPWWRRLLALAAVPAAGAVLVGLLLVNAAARLLLPALFAPRVASFALDWALPVAATWTTAWLLYRSYPSAAPHGCDVRPGASVAAAGIEVLRHGFGWYVGHLPSLAVVYGSLATAIALLLWVYLVHCTVLFGAEVIAVCHERRRQAGSPPSPGEVGQAGKG